MFSGGLWSRLGGGWPLSVPGGRKGRRRRGTKETECARGAVFFGVRWEGREGGRVPDETCMKSASG